VCNAQIHLNEFRQKHVKQRKISAAENKKGTKRKLCSFLFVCENFPA